MLPDDKCMPSIDIPVTIIRFSSGRRQNTVDRCKAEAQALEAHVATSRQRPNGTSAISDIKLSRYSARSAFGPCPHMLVED
jgi:hypothetical protein